MAPGDAGADADALRRAMKGFGTDEAVLIRILAKPDPMQMALLRHSYSHHLGRDLEKDVASETSGYLEEGLVALIRGPLMNDVHNLRKSMKGPGTNEVVMNDVLLSRSNADMAAIKKAYYDTYHHDVSVDVKGDLSMKTERHFSMVLAANRAEESAPVYPQSTEQDVSELYKATEGKVGTDQMTVCNILSTRSDAQIRAIAHAFEQKYHIPLEKVIEKEFSGHMESALLMQLRGGADRAMRDAMLLEDTMSGMGTKDSLLIQRVVRLHWDRQHMDQVKKAYRHRFHKELATRVKGEVKGDVEKLLLAILA
jgi:annexin A7/11